MDDHPVIALDVGGSSVKSALVAAGQQITGKVCVDDIESRATADEILNTLAAIITGHLDKVKSVRGIAFAFPGPFDYEQGLCLIQNQAKYESLYGLNVGARLKGILHMPTLEVRYRNDAEAAILGEACYGAGIPYSRVIGMTLGTGLGSAFMADGVVITKGAGLPPNGWLYSFPFGNQRADDVFSTRGLLARLRERGVHAVDIASALQKGDKDRNRLEAIFASFGADLGTFLEPFILDFRADAVLITGGISEIWDRFAPTLIQSLSVPVVRGVLGNRAALFGAAALYF
ncbi:MAG TPA: ROK family protein [Anaerolineales bacterium]|nr:ROK family protein [Anaerolineales bacterium]